jgi:hypothetical protein
VQLHLIIDIFDSFFITLLRWSFILAFKTVIGSGVESELRRPTDFLVRNIDQVVENNLIVEEEVEVGRKREREKKNKKQAN